MPIAQCTVDPALLVNAPEGDVLVNRWAEASGQSANEMTVNFVAAVAQHGKRHAVMAQLLLPTLWSGEARDNLQLGLARALQDYFQLDVAQVHVVTVTVDSGAVVENATIQRW